MEKRVRTRFAPSPTGPLHMGGVRTALYSFLFAKKHGGDFILRIEDTDQNRFVEGAEQYIIDALNWCGIKPDEGVGTGGNHAPYRQSERKNIYRQYAEQLIKSGHAYYAFDTADELEQTRKKAESEKRNFSYDASSRAELNNSLNLSAEQTEKKIAEGKPYVIRLKVEPGEEIAFDDLVRGRVVFKSDIVDDKVLLKSDGMPTYHLAHIVDDVLMEITHAIRGEEWLPSAPAHILIYKYLFLESLPAGEAGKMPAYAHLPLLLKPDGNGKLSKRDGDRLGFPVFPLEWKDPSTNEISTGYREKGYYPEAFVNMLALLGWNPGSEKEIFNMEELTALFSFDHVHKAGAKFNPDKTKWFNEQWLQKMDTGEMAERLRHNLVVAGIDMGLKSKEYFIKAVELLKPRVQFENEMTEKGQYLFAAPSGYDQQVLAKKWKPDYRSFFNALATAFAGLNNFKSADIEILFKETAASNNLKPGEVLQLLRVFISGQGAGVDLFPMLELLGREEVVSRINNALAKI